MDAIGNPLHPACTHPKAIKVKMMQNPIFFRILQCKGDKLVERLEKSVTQQKLSGSSYIMEIPNLPCRIK